MNILQRKKSFRKFLNPNIHKDGHIIILSTSGSPIFDISGQFVGYRGVDADVTEQKMAEQALAESEEKFRNLFYNHSAVKLIINPDNGDIIEANQAAADYYGWTIDELKIMNINQINTLLPDFTKREMDKVISANKTHFEFKHRKADGSIRDVEVFSSKIQIGKNLFLHSIIHDITDRKSAQEKLLLHTVALQAAANAIMITDKDGNIVSINPAFTTLTGYTQDEVLGKRSNVLISGMQNDTFYASLWKTILNGNVWRNEIVNKKKDGTIYNEEMTITPVMNNGTISHFIAIKQDITEQKKLQQQLFQTQKVETIGTLAGGIAHDFNNILGIILAYVSLLEKGGLIPEKVKESHAAIKKAVLRGASLVKQILTFARKSDVNFTMVRIPDVIQELTKMLQETFPKTVEITSIFGNAVPMIRADQTQLHQALLNLCVNARDAMPKGGEIKIDVTVFDKSELWKKYANIKYDKYLCISISDTGTGIEPKILKNIFDPFFTTKEIGKGTGMGLAVVNGVAQTHHGFLDVSSTIGVGTTFYLYIPVLHDEVGISSESKIDSGVIDGGSETILVVEDEDLLRNIVTSVLEAKGYNVIIAKDGYEAVKIYEERNNDINLVFTDIGLPKMSGIEEFWALKKINSKVKVLLASGFLDPQNKSDLFIAGAKGFIQKPYNSDEVLKNIREILDYKAT